MTFLRVLALCCAVLIFTGGCAAPQRREEPRSMNAGNTANLTAQPAAPALLSSTRNLSVISGAQKLAHILIKKGFKTGSSGNFDSQLNALIIVTLNRYQSASFGSYQKFSEIRNVGFSPIGPGRFKYFFLTECCTCKASFKLL
jgi:hypothetical protein